jgi:hypothetical protein
VVAAIAAAGGGTVGYNWQAGQAVVGVEADAAGSSIKASATSQGVTINDSIRALGSATGRLGFAASSALLYVKGGYAWANNSVNALAGGTSFTESRVHSGWTVGCHIRRSLDFTRSGRRQRLVSFGRPVRPGNRLGRYARCQLTKATSYPVFERRADATNRVSHRSTKS